MTKIGILGLGSIGARHLLNFESLGCKVIGYDPVMCELDQFHEVWDCDAVVIASPTKMHYEHIMEGHSRRVPMLVEKPLVMTRKEWQGVPLSYVWMVGYNLRFHSTVHKVRQWLSEGIIGKPIWAQFTCGQFNDRPTYRNDGVVLNWSHEIDLAIHLLGKAEVLTAAVTAREDLADILLKHDHNECHSVIHLDYLTLPERRGFVIVGPEGVIEADLVSREATVKDCDAEVIHRHLGRDSFDANYISEAQAFLALLDDKIKPDHLIGCTARQAYDVVDICLEVKEFHGQ